MAIKYQLKVQKRKIHGRKVKQLRRDKILPANIYGRNIKSLSVQLKLDDFEKIYSQAGTTALIELSIDKEPKTRSVLITNVQLHPVFSQPLHVDFFQVNLKEKITTHIPIEIVGVSPAVEQKGGVLIEQFNELEVEALPTDLPDKISVDISNLNEIDDSIKVSDLPIDRQKLKPVLSDNQIILKIAAPIKEEEKAPAETPESAENAEASEPEKSPAQAQDSQQPKAPSSSEPAAPSEENKDKNPKSS